MILKNQRYLIANNPSSISNYGAKVFWIYTKDGGFYHKDRMRRIGRIRGQQSLIWGLLK